MIRVEICIKNAVMLYGHCEDHVRPAQPSISAVLHPLLAETARGVEVYGERTYSGSRR